MASSRVETETKVIDDLSSLTCSICIDWLKKPRKLPNCSHTFCEECIFQFVTKLNEEVNDSVFMCPVCRQVNSVPESSQDIMSWIQTLETDIDIAEKVNSEVGEGKVELCVPCKETRATTRAVKMCLDCREHYCGNCCNLVHRFEALQDHPIIEIGNGYEDYPQQREINRIMSECLKCRKHPDKKLTLLCTEDKSLWCISCVIENKRKGNTFVELKDEISEDEIKEKRSILLDKSSKLSAITKAIIKEKKKNEIDNKMEIENIRSKLQEIRSHVNKMVDLMEENVTEQCKVFAKLYAVGSIEDIANVQKINDYFFICRSLLEKSVQQGSVNLQYAVLNHVEESISKLEREVIELGNNCKKQGFKISVETMLNDLLQLRINDTDKLIKVEKTESDIELPCYKEAQMLTQCTIAKVGDYDIRPQPDAFPSYTGITYLSNNTMCLVDNSISYCVFVNEFYDTLASVSLVENRSNEDESEMGKPFCVADLKNGAVAIGIPNQRKIVFVSCEKTYKIIGEIYTSSQPRAMIGLKNGDLAVAWNEPVAFGVLSLSSFFKFEDVIYFDRDASGRLFKSFVFIAVDEARAHVIQPCYIDKAVYCFDFHGTPKFTYKPDDLLKPGGVATDKDGYVYVCERQNACIHILSPNGSLVRLLKEGCPSWPITLGFRYDNTMLVVTNGSLKHREICVFKLGD